MSAILPTAVPALAWALLDFVWQGLLVGWIAALVLALLRKSRPQARYAVACAALLLCAALPLAGTVQRLMEVHTPTTLLPLASANVVADAVPGHAPVATLTAERVAVWEHVMQDKLPLVILFWSCGAGLLAIRMMLGLAWVRRRSRPSQYRPDPVWQARLDRLAVRLGIARRVTLGVNDDLASPVTAGWWRPVVLVPASLLSGMPPDLLEALLAHELAHVRRFDYLVNLIQSAVEILLFYHPTVWWLSNRIRVEREQIADDLAASALGEPRRLALALSELDLFQLSTPQLAHAAHGGNLMSRIKRLVRPESEPLNWKMAVPILGLALSAAFYSHAQTAQAAATPEPQVIKTKQHRSDHGRDNAYALVRDTDHGTNLSGDSADWKDIEAAKRKLGGDFLWFRDGGKTWVIQDKDVLAKASAAWAPVDRMGKEMDAYGKEMDAHGKKMEVLGEQMGAAAAKIQPDDAKVRRFERRMDNLGRQMERLGRKMAKADAAERERLERDMSELGRKMSELGNQFGQQTQSAVQAGAQTSMNDLSRQMNELSKPMSELGTKMGALGAQMEQESKAADKAVRELIRDATARGLARPSPDQG